MKQNKKNPTNTTFKNLLFQLSGLLANGADSWLGQKPFPELLLDSLLKDFSYVAPYFMTSWFLADLSSERSSTPESLQQALHSGVPGQHGWREENTLQQPARGGPEEIGCSIY